MSKSGHLFYNLVARVEQSGAFSEILLAQQVKYNLQPFKIQGIDCEAIRKIYQSIENKYQVTRQLDLDPHNWNENQRRVFIWFIIFYTYFLEQEGEQLKSIDWGILSSIFFNKKPEFLEFQYFNMIKVKGKIYWSPQEDQLLLSAYKEQEGGKWNQVAKNIFFKSNYRYFKSPKHCRERWLNHLDTNKKRGQWIAQEDIVIFKFVAEYGKRWCKMVPVLNDTRTEHMIKNRFNSLISKQRRSKKEREEHLILRIIKQLKKQIANAELRKKKKQSNLRDNQQMKFEQIPTPDEKLSPKINHSKQTIPSLKIEEDPVYHVEHSHFEDKIPTQEFILSEQIQMSPVINQKSVCFQLMSNPYFGNYSYGPVTVPFEYSMCPQVYPFTNMYWM